MVLFNELVSNGSWFIYMSHTFIFFKWLAFSKNLSSFIRTV